MLPTLCDERTWMILDLDSKHYILISLTRFELARCSMLNYLFYDERMWAGIVYIYNKWI